VKRLALRWLKFNLAAGLGIVIQLGRLKLLLIAGMNVYVATGLAVEFALLHNFIWHERSLGWIARVEAGRLLRFSRSHLGNGAVSILGNMGLMWLFVRTSPHETRAGGELPCDRHLFYPEFRSGGVVCFPTWFMLGYAHPALARKNPRTQSGFARNHYDCSSFADFSDIFQHFRVEPAV
jgi:putative flippase GtrA